jgi:hypothetical protein
MIVISVEHDFNEITRNSLLLNLVPDLSPSWRREPNALWKSLALRERNFRVRVLTPNRDLLNYALFLDLHRAKRRSWGTYQCSVVVTLLLEFGSNAELFGMEYDVRKPGQNL